MLLGVRASLHLASVPDALLCREAQLDAIVGFCGSRISTSCGGALYVSGSPGLGKSLTVRQVPPLLPPPSPYPPTTSCIRLHELLGAQLSGCRSLNTLFKLFQAHETIKSRISSRDRICFINAFKLESPAAVYATILQAVDGSVMNNPGR